MKYYLVEIKNPLFSKPSYHNWGELTQEDFDKKIEYWTYPNCSAKLLTFNTQLELTRKQFEILGEGMQIYSTI